MELDFNIEQIKEYEKKIGLEYEVWSEKTKLEFFLWKQFKDQIKKLDNYVFIEKNPDFTYNQKLQEYLDMGFKILYSNGDKDNPLRDDTSDIIQNEKILYHQNNGIIGNITKVEDQEGRISLKPFDFYYEIKNSYSNNMVSPEFEFRQKEYGSPEKIKKVMMEYDFVSPWNMTNEQLLLTRQLNGTTETTKKIIATFDSEIIDALGYVKKKDGKIYSKYYL